MAELEFRTPSPDEIGDCFRVSLQGYGMDASEQEIAHERLVYEPARSYGARDDGKWVGSGGAFSFELTLPGGAIVPAAGITMVGVAPTHRRRGILTELMRWLHDDAAARGEPIAILTASEASIYRRFGYGVATEIASVRIPTAAVRFDPPLPADNGSFRVVDPGVDTSTLAALYDRARRERAGWVSRSDVFWAQVLDDLPSGHAGRTPRRAVVHHNAGGEPDGYATWRIAVSDPLDRVAVNTVHIEELVGATADVELALWQFLSQIDLATTLVWRASPPEPLLRWRLVEPRQLRIEARSDLVWARLLDVATVLGARSYDAAGTLSIGVHDPFRPSAGGTFHLRAGGPDAPASCARVADGVDPDAEMTTTVADLSSIALGGVAPSLLARAGRLHAATPDALRLADALFVTHPAPWCPLEF